MSTGHVTRQECITCDSAQPRQVGERHVAAQRRPTVRITSNLDTYITRFYEMHTLPLLIARLAGLV